MVPARADEFKPGYLQLTQLDQETYDVLWKIPAIDESTTLKVKPQFPDGTEALTRGAQHLLARRHGAALAHPCAGRARREGHLLLAALGNADRRARAARAPGRHRAARAHPAGEPQLRRQAQPWLDWKSSGPTPILGIEHILSGFDHLLFVLALVLLVRGGADMLVTITAFTAAHSLTLAGATLGWVHVPRPPVEASHCAEHRLRRVGDRPRRGKAATA